MTDESRSFQHQTPDEQAGYWLALLDSPLADDERRKAFEHWLADPENLKAWQKLRTFETRLHQIDAEQITRLQNRIAQLSPTSPNPVGIPPTLLKRARRTWAMPLVACVLLAVLANVARQAGYFADYRTLPGEQTHITLEDGSQVLLNTATALSVDYTEQARKLTLYKGEAHFEVAADAGRPFTVSSPDARVTALGTVFDVKRAESATTVTVFEHAVSIVFADGAKIDRLNTGEQAVYRQAEININPTVNLKQAGAWQNHRLVFANRPLGDVVNELNRYRSGIVLITDRRLAAHEVTGAFDSRDTDAILQAIAKSLPITEHRLTNRIVLLSPKT